MENTKSKKLLWVEDDYLLGSILSEKLSKTEIDLVLAKSGEEAITFLKALEPDVIMVDLLLAGTMNGFDVLEELNKDQKYDRVPKIVLSNLSKPEDLKRATDLGVKKFMLKASTSLDEILDEVRRQVAGS